VVKVVRIGVRVGECRVFEHEMFSNRKNQKKNPYNRS